LPPDAFAPEALGAGRGGSLVHGLDEAAVVGLVTAPAGHDLTEPDIALARAIHQETEGSPFFIGEILRHLSESGAIFQEGERWTFKGDIAGLGVPEGIKEVIGRRLNRLSEETNKVLHLAAVIGRQSDVALLTRIAETPEDAILDALDEAAAAALVAEVSGTADRFAFSHALIRTTLYEELTAARRARLHRKIVEALEELTGANPEARIDELAHHWLAATQVGDQAKAIRYARQAGDRALANLAFEAAAHYERALAVLEPRDADGRRLRCDLLLALGDVQRRAGSPSYRETVATAVDVARTLGAGERLARAVLGHARPGGFYANPTVVDEGLLALYEEARAALGDMDSLLRARVLGQLATEFVFTPERERRHALSRDARRLPRPLGRCRAPLHRRAGDERAPRRAPVDRAHAPGPRCSSTATPPATPRAPASSSPPAAPRPSSLAWRASWYASNGCSSDSPVARRCQVIRRKGSSGAHRLTVATAAKLPVSVLGAPGAQMTGCHGHWRECAER
jgi:hypothetical protein